MKKKISILAVLFNLLAIAFIGTSFAAFADVPPLPCVLAVGGVATVYHIASYYGKLPSASFLEGIQVEIWQNHIEGNLFKGNEFLLQSTNADQYVLAGKVVHIAQAGTPSGVSKNRTELPATVKKRVDTDITYVLDEYTTDPRLIPNADKYELSYDLRESVVAEDEMELRENMADDTLIKWAPDVSVLASSIIPTTGGSAAASTWVPGTTGNRKIATEADVRAIRKAFIKQNMKGVPNLLISAEMEDQIISSLASNSLATYQATYEMTEGGLKKSKLHGVQIWVRSEALYYSNTNVVRPFGASLNVTDSDAGLAWVNTAVELAKSGVEAFQNIGDPTYYGDIYSFLLRAGGRKRRADQKGVFALVATTV